MSTQTRTTRFDTRADALADGWTGIPKNHRARTLRRHELEDGRTITVAILDVSGGRSYGYRYAVEAHLYDQEGNALTGWGAGFQQPLRGPVSDSIYLTKEINAARQLGAIAEMFRADELDAAPETLLQKALERWAS